MGPGPKDDKSIRILNRIITWDEEGIKYEADQRHAEIIVRELEMKEDSKTAITPGVKPSEANPEPADEHELVGSEASLYRALTARANYLTQDRSDIQFATKELARGMAKPTVGDMKN